MTNRIIPHPHEARRFQETGSVLLVREVDPQPVRFSHVDVPYWQWTPDAASWSEECHAILPQVVWRDGLNPFECGAAAGLERLCPFPSVGEEVWFAEEFSLRVGLDGYQEDISNPRLWADEPLWFGYDPICETNPDYKKQPRGKLRPASEMPKWAARLWGVVVSRECRRVSTITDDEARDAGHLPCIEQGEVLLSESEVFFDLFDADPWAWVVRVERKGAGA